MTKSFDVSALDCAHCAQRLEDMINTIPSTECKVSFAMGRIKITAPDENFEKIMKEVKRVAKVIEPDLSFKELR